jgi:hypothetical protein
MSGFVHTNRVGIDTSQSLARLSGTMAQLQSQNAKKLLLEEEKLERGLNAQVDLVNGYDASKLAEKDRQAFDLYKNHVTQKLADGAYDENLTQLKLDTGYLKSIFDIGSTYYNNEDVQAAQEVMRGMVTDPARLSAANEALEAPLEYNIGLEDLRAANRGFNNPFQGELSIVDGALMVDNDGVQTSYEGVDRSMATQGYSLDQYQVFSDLGSIQERANDYAIIAGHAGEYSPETSNNLFFSNAVMASREGRAAAVASDHISGQNTLELFDLVNPFISGGGPGVEAYISENIIGTESQDAARAAYDTFISSTQSEWNESIKPFFKVPTSKTALSIQPGVITPTPSQGAGSISSRSFYTPIGGSGESTINIETAGNRLAVYPTGIWEDENGDAYLSWINTLGASEGAERTLIAGPLRANLGEYLNNEFNSGIDDVLGYWSSNPTTAGSLSDIAPPGSQPDAVVTPDSLGSTPVSGPAAPTPLATDSIATPQAASIAPDPIPDALGTSFNGRDYPTEIFEDTGHHPLARRRSFELNTTPGFKGGNVDVPYAATRHGSNSPVYSDVASKIYKEFNAGVKESEPPTVTREQIKDLINSQEVIAALHDAGLSAATNDKSNFLFGKKEQQVKLAVKVILEILDNE